MPWVLLVTVPRSKRSKVIRSARLQISLVRASFSSLVRGLIISLSADAIDELSVISCVAHSGRTTIPRRPEQQLPLPLLVMVANARQQRCINGASGVVGGHCAASGRSGSLVKSSRPVSVLLPCTLNREGTSRYIQLG